jgi:hypothetical protein
MTSVQRDLFSLLVALVGAGTALAQSVVPWTFRADFQHGFSGWISFPLTQDIGFDPTLAVEKSDAGWELIREVTSAGHKRLKLGMVRPIHFLARPETLIKLSYRTDWAAPSPRLRLILAGAEGHRYEARIPSTAGLHDVTVSGKQLAIGAKDVPVEAVVIEGAVEAPSTTLPNRISLRGFEMASFRFRGVPLLSPALLSENSDDVVRVAARPLMAGEPLLVELGPAAAPVTLKLTDPGGKKVFEKSLSASQKHTIPLGEGATGLWTADLTNPDARSTFSFVVMAKAGRHPRTLFTASRFQQLKTGKEFEAFRKQIQAQAHAQTAQLKTNPSAGTNILRFSPGRSLRAEYDGELTPYFQLLDSYANAIASCSLDYALNGDGTSLAAAKRNLLAVSQWPTWTPPRFASHGMHTYYEAGLFAQKLAVGYDLIATELTQTEKDQVSLAFWKNVIDPTVDEYFRHNRMPVAASNWMANSVGGALMAIAATEGDIPGWRDREGVALAQLTVSYVRNLKDIFPGDGGELEPTGYQHFAMEGFSWGAAALASLRIRPPELERLFSSLWWPKYAMVTPDIVLDGGDFNGELRTFSGFAYAAENAGIPALRAFYDQRSKRDPAVLDMVCCTRPTQSSADPPLSRVFAERGSAVLRSGWDALSTVISLRAGPWFNHEHHDQGSFQIAAFGDKIISEAGYASYYRDPNYPTYFTQAPGHNTVLIDDDPFSQANSAGDFWRGLGGHLPRIVTHLFSPQIDYVETDLTGAYDEQLSTFKRRFLFLRPDVLIVSDELSAPQPHSFSWLLHPVAGTMPSVSGNRVRIETASVVTDALSSDSQSMWETNATPLPISLFQDLRSTIQDRYVFRLRSAQSRKARFTVGMQFRPRGTAPEISSALSSPSAAGFEGRQSGWAAIFRTGPAPLQHSGFTTDAQVFATRGDHHYMAIAATTVSRGSDRLFSSSHAVNVASSQSARELQFDIAAAVPSAVEIQLPADTTALFIDDAPASSKSGRIQLSKGEHRVRILHGKSL